VQNKIIKQKKEQNHIQKELATKYGTDEEIVQKIENMNSVKGQNRAL